MNAAFLALNLLSAISFLGFGVACLSTRAMRLEFARYGLAQYRVLTGALQVAGAVGLLIGIWFTPLGLAAALGLSLQMAAGVGVRIHIRDTWFQCVPAAFFAILNAILVALYCIR